MEKNKKVGKFDFNIKRYIALCFKSWLAFVICVVVCLALGGAYCALRTPLAQVMAQLMLKDDSAGSSSMMMMGQLARSFSIGDMFGGSSTTENESSVLASHAVFLGTAKELDLCYSYSERKYGFKWVPTPLNSPIKLIAPEGCADTISVALDFKVKRLDNGNIDFTVKHKRKVLAEGDNVALPARIKTPYGDFSLEKTKYFDTSKSNTYKARFMSYDMAGEVLGKTVKVFVPDRKTDFISLSYVTPDPKFGKLLLNTIIDNYINVSNEYKLTRSAESLALVDQRLASLSQELLQSEGQLEDFKKNNKLTDVEVDAQYLMTKTGAIEAQLLSAQTSYEVLKMTKDFLSNPEHKYSLIPELLSLDTPISGEQGASQISQYNSMILNRMRMLNSAKPNNVSITQLEEQIDALRSNIVTSIDRMYNNAYVALKDLKGEDGKTKTRISELPSLERQYLILKRDNMLQEQLYLFLLQQREEINMNLASRSLPAQTVDVPYVRMESPGLPTVIVLALSVFLGCVFAAVYVLLFRMKATPVYDASEVDGLLNVPVMESLKDDKSQADASLAVLGSGVNSDSFRRLRSDVQFALKGCDGKVVAVSSVNKGEGKTFVAANLAVSLALAGKKVLLVDTVLNDPQLAQILNVSVPSVSLADFVKSSKPVSDIQVSAVSVDHGASLDVIASGKYSLSSSDVVASDRFAQLIEYLKSRYDYIIVDVANIKDFSDIFYVTDVADLTLIVCRGAVITPMDVEYLNSLYSAGRLKRMAVVKNALK